MGLSAAIVSITPATQGVVAELARFDEGQGHFSKPPKSVVDNWVGEAERYFPTLPIALFKETGTARQGN